MQQSTPWSKLEADACAVSQLTRSQSGAVCELIESGLSLLATGLISADPQPASYRTIVTAGLLASNLGALRCSHVLAQQGYYVQSNGLLRNVYENWIAVRYLSSKPESADRWLNSSLEPPSHGLMLKDVQWKNDKEKDRAKEFYHVLCKFAHTSFAHVLPNLGKNGAVWFGTHFDEGLFRKCAYLSSMLIAFTMDEVAGKVNPAKQQKWHAERTRLMSDIEAFIVDENSRAGQPPRDCT